MSDISLSDKLAKIQPKLSNYQTRLDEISHEIRAIESSLTQSGFSLPLTVEVDSRTEMDESAVIDELEGYVNGIEWTFDETLHWSNLDGKGFRLYYRFTKQEGHLSFFEGDASRTKSGQPEIVLEKPLIDTKIEIRLKCAPKLFHLLDQVEKKLAEIGTKEAFQRKAGSTLDKVATVGGNV